MGFCFLVLRLDMCMCDAPIILFSQTFIKWFIDD